MKRFRIVIGIAFWCGLFGVLWGLVGSPGRTAPSTSRQYFSDLWAYYTSTRRLEFCLPKSCALSTGDPVFAADGKGSLQQVGIIVRVSDGDTARSPHGNTTTAQAVLFPSAPEPSLPVNASYLSVPDSIDWVVQTLLPEERRRQLEAELSTALQEHHREILQALQPVVKKSVRDARAALEQDLPLILEKHRPQLNALASKNKDEILKRQLVPLVKEEIWPIVCKESEPLVRQLSGELWERVSLWGFVWRGVFDKLPVLRRKPRLEDELRRFLNQEAVPIFARHEEDFLALMEVIVRDILDSEKVKAVVQRSLAEAAQDPELQRVVKDILHDVVTSPRFWKAVRQNLSSSEAQEALLLTGDRLEPSIRRMGDLVLGTRENGLTPEFTRVLRQQILLKDGHGIIVGDLPQSGPQLKCTPLEAWFSGTKP